MKVGIIGAGNIATAMATALNGLTDTCTPYAIASRDLAKAKAFAKKWNFQKAYGSYEELVNDPEVDLIYVATPHSHHFQHAKLCIEHRKPVLVEKAFTETYEQAKELIALAEEKKVFITEAIWTRYIPARHIVKDLLESGAIGEVTSMTAEFSAKLTHIPRLCEPSLAGGALLDLGMYALTFASMYFGDDIVSVTSTCEKYETGVDGTDEIHYIYADGKTATLRTTFTKHNKNEAEIYGSNGHIFVKELNNYNEISVYNKNGELVKTCDIPPQINGYEYEVLACKQALENGALECKEMPHAETLEIMKQMDDLRCTWGTK